MCGRITIITGTIVTTAHSVWRPRARPLMPTAHTSTATRCTTAVVATAATAAESPHLPCICQPDRSKLTGRAFLSA
ncbi:MAG: hypothetical protein IJX33_08010 [Akkermansia sp.]|nr:hypothetical protein [Akkermansia sp.]